MIFLLVTCYFQLFISLYTILLHFQIIDKIEVKYCLIAKLFAGFFAKSSEKKFRNNFCYKDNSQVKSSFVHFYFSSYISQYQGLISMKQSTEIPQNLTYFWKKKNIIYFVLNKETIFFFNFLIQNVWQTFEVFR